MTKTPAKVTFYRVRDNQSKLDLICGKAQEAIDQEKRLLILVGTIQAAQYIDALLWRHPVTGFVPHVITQSPTEEWIAIALGGQNVNQASRVLNLQVEAVLKGGDVEEIYELFDETHPQKTVQSEQRLEAYRAKGHAILER